MTDIKYCRTRLRRISRNLHRLAAGFPAGSQFRPDTEGLCLVIEGVTAPTFGPLDIAIGRLPLLARRASAAERTLLTDQANKYLAMTA